MKYNVWYKSCAVSVHSLMCIFWNVKQVHRLLFDVHSCMANV